MNSVQRCLLIRNWKLMIGARNRNWNNHTMGLDNIIGSSWLNKKINWCNLRKRLKSCNGRHWVIQSNENAYSVYYHHPASLLVKLQERTWCQENWMNADRGQYKTKRNIRWFHKIFCSNGDMGCRMRHMLRQRRKEKYTVNHHTQPIIGRECPHESYNIVCGGANVGKLWMGRYDLVWL